MAFPAFAGEAGGPVYKLEWLDAFYEGTGTALPKSVSPGSLSVTPNQNRTTVQRLQLTFSFSGKEEATVPANTVEIRLPYSIFKNAAGGNAESSVVVPLPMNTSFNYYIDKNTNEIVIYNFAEISEALIFTVMIDYKVMPSNVALPSSPGETIQPYVNSAIDADIKISRPNMPVITDSTNPISLSYKTDSKLSSISKSVSSVSAAWPASWGTAPSDAADYFYILWYISTSYSSSSTQPFTLAITDMPGAAEGGQVAGWQLPGKPYTQANYADGWDNNLAEFNAAAQNARRVQTPSTSGETFYTYVYLRYPRTNLIEDPAIPGRKYLRVYNQASATLTGDYGATDTKTSLNTSYLYAETNWVVPGGSSSIYKNNYNYSNATGMIDRLESAYLAGSTEAIPLHYGPYHFYVNSTQQQYKRTMDENGNYGMVDWTAVHTDNKISFDTSTASSTSYYRLVAGDYKISKLILAKPSERVYGEPNAFGSNSLIAQDPAKYGSSVVQVTTVDNPAETDWITLGTSTVNPPSTSSWTFTPADGSAATTVSSGNITLNLETLLPGQDVLGIRVLQTSKAAEASQNYQLGISLYPTKHVIDGLRPPPGHTGDIRNSVNLYNLASTVATGGSIAGDSHYATVSAYINLNRYTTSSYHSKSIGTITQNDAIKALQMPFTLNLYHSLNVPLGYTRDQAIALNALQEQTEGIFYDLLPIGTVVDTNTIRVSGYYNNYPGTYSIETIDNFRGTGRTLLIVRVYKQETTQNYYFSSPTLYTGFTLRFTVLNSYNNLQDNPKYGVNYSAYESTVGPLGSGVADLPPSSFSEAAAKTAFTNVNGVPEADQKRFMHASASWSVNPPVATELGFNKMVKSPEDSSYSKETIAQAGGTYTYRLRLANKPETSSLNLIFYDSMEDRAPQTEPEYWKGTLESIDLSHPKLTWGIEPVVYYATQYVNPKDVVGDRLVVGGVINTAVWSILDLNAPYPADLKSIAIDMRFKPDGTVFVLPPERSLIVTLTMRAPGDPVPYLDPVDYAWNSAFLSAQSLREGVLSANAVVDVTPTKVSLKPVDLAINKSSSPATGTPEAPAIVYANNIITYMLTLKNTNTAETITSIVLEDSIPDGLIVNTAGITHRFGTSGAYTPVSASTRVQLTQTGQKLSFAIDKLTAGETVSFQIPARIALPEGTGAIRYENTAVVTRAFGYDQEIKSNTTYHEMPVAAVDLLADKVFNAGGRTPKAGEFQLELTDTTTARNRVGGPYPNSGDTPYSFAIDPLYYGAPGTYNYYLREIVPNPPETNMTYSPTVYYVSVRVVYNTTTRKLDSFVTYRLSTSYGSIKTPPVSFINSYKANGNFIPTIGKLVTKTTFPQSFYDNKFTATLTDQFGRVQSATNIGGVFTFSSFAFEEKDIGHTFVYTITENPGTQDSVLYDGRTITLKVLVTDLGNGQLGFEPTYWDGDTPLGTSASFINEFQATSHSMTKVWTVPANSGLFLPNPLPDVSVQLIRDGVPYGPAVTVTGESGDNLTQTTWAYTWPSIPKYKADGSWELSVYTVREVTPPAHFHSSSSGSTITNTFRPGIFTAKKLWEGLPSPPAGGVYAVSFSLHQTILDDTTSWYKQIGPAATLDGTPDPAPTVIPGATPAQDITYQEITPWVIQWTNLPANGPDPRPVPQTANVSFEYKVVESKVTLIADPNAPTPFVLDTTTSASSHITNQYTLTSFTAVKEWLNGPEDDRPEVTFTLWQDGAPYAPETTGILDGSPDGVAGLTSGEHTAWAYTWENLPKFKNADLELHVYSFRETNLTDYTPIYSGDPYDLVYNSYVQPTITVKATKVWSGGPQSDRTVPELVLYHYFPAGPGYPAMEPRPVTVAPVIDETGAPDTYVYTWNGIKTTTLAGIPYKFFLNETGEAGGFILFGNNTYQVIKEGDEKNGFTVTNKFVVPTGNGRVVKTWIGGPEADQVPIKIKAFRQTSAMAAPEEVTTPQPVMTIQGNGVHIYTWNNIPWTDANGLPYTYTIQETDAVNGQYVINGNTYNSEIKGFDITNTYVPPVGAVSATKTWQGGPATHHTQVELTLWRQTTDMPSPEMILSSPVVTGQNPYLYTWNNQKLADPLGKPYTFTVRETGAEGGSIDVLDSTYTVTTGIISQTQLSVTNTYVIPRGKEYATKTWIGGPVANKVAPTLDLYRQTQDMASPELVQATPTVLPGKEGMFYYTWDNIEQTDVNGLPYAFTVRERGASGGLYTVGSDAYFVTILDMDVTNLYRQPKADITAVKTWIGGTDSNHTAVKLILQRTNGKMATPETILTAPQISAGPPYTYTWSNLELRDFDGIPYIYSIKEEGEAGNIVTVNGFHYGVEYTRPSETSFNVRNSFLPPDPCVFQPQAKKSLKGAKLTDDQFTFCLTDHEGTEHEVTNSANGTVLLPALTFTEPGTYVLSLIERGGTKPGMRYDGAKYELTLTLVINSDNKLEVTKETWTKDGKAYTGVPLFQNTQEAPTYPSIYVPLNVTKVVKNGALKAGEFTFVLKDAKGKELARAVNDKNGVVAFPDRSFSREVSNYIYTIHEVAGDSRHVTYDKTVYTVKVSTRANNGRLFATVALEKDGVPYSGDLVFTNVRRAPATGDKTLFIIGLITGLGLFAGGTAFLLNRRRKNKKA